MLKVFGSVLLAFGFLFVCAMTFSFVTELVTTSDDMAVGLGYVIVALAFASLSALLYYGLKESGLIAVAVLMVLTGACTRVDPGWEGIKVDMLGSDRGEAYPIVTGRVWYNPYTYNVYQFPTFLQRVVWTRDPNEGSPDDESITFRSTEGYAFNADVGMGLSFVVGSTPDHFVRYRRTAFEIIDGPFRDIVRDAYVSAASQMEGLDILGPGITDLNAQVTASVQATLGEGVDIDYVNIIGQPRVDPRVEESINAVIEATQQANVAEETVRQRTAEAAQRVAQANGIADSMRIEAEAKADAISIEAEALRQFGAQVIQMRAIEKWDGVMPRVTGEGAVPFINVPMGAQ